MEIGRPWKATGGVYMRYKNVPAALRWINFMNPYFYTIMGLIKIEFDDYQFPGGFSQDVVAHFGYDEFELEQVSLNLGPNPTLQTS